MVCLKYLFEIWWVYFGVGLNFCKELFRKNVFNGKFVRDMIYLVVMVVENSEYCSINEFKWDFFDYLLII